MTGRRRSTRCAQSNARRTLFGACEPVFSRPRHKLQIPLATSIATCSRASSDGPRACGVLWGSGHSCSRSRVLAVLAALESSASTLLRALQAILGIGAIIVGRRIYRRSQALLFPRTRMNAAAIFSAVIGAIMVVAGMGLPGILVIAAGLVGFVGATA